MKINPLEIKATVSKSFFIETITRDLGLSDCILDLIDNSIDKAIDTNNVDVMQTLLNGSKTNKFKNAKISLRLSKNKFCIEDNCGGISISEAKDGVFHFGDPSLASKKGGLSVYGIGMKRSFFKIGRYIRMESATKKDWFSMNIDVEDWKTKKEWTFEFDKTGKTKNEKYSPQTTRITITNLLDEIIPLISQTSFIQGLLENISKTYSLFLVAGLKISVNGKNAKTVLPELVEDDKFTPGHKLIETKSNVKILIHTGITAKEDKKAHGWYIFCNGRVILEAHKTERTGWGSLLPQWHTKFRHFVGYVYFQSNEVRNLPWTTTKQDIVYESEPYRIALREMQVQARPVLNFLNKLYPSELEKAEIPEREALATAKSIPINLLSKQDTIFGVVIDEKLKKKIQKSSIQYQKPIKEINRIKQRINKKWMSNADVGKHTFDYFLKQECED